MNNTPLIPSPFDDEVKLTQHINDKYRCLCSECVEWRRMERKRQERLDKERKEDGGSWF